MLTEILASSPGRICLAGESLDWMTRGSSIVGAIDLRATVQVSPHDDHAFLLQSGDPFYLNRKVKPEDLGRYTNDVLDYLQATIKVLLDVGVPLQPFFLEATTLLPTKAGVSSSAAITTASIAAIASALGQDLTGIEICSYAFKVEDQELKTGAGQMDFYACGLGGLQYMNCSTQPPHLERFVTPNTRIILVDTLQPHSTKKFVSSKKKRFQSGEPLIMKYVAQAPKVVEQMRALLGSFDTNIEEIGLLVTLCHLYLKDFVQCSTELLDKAVEVCVANGAYGAKLTGSGMGGCMFALTPSDKVEQITSALSELPVRVYETKITGEGVKVTS